MALAHPNAVSAILSIALALVGLTSYVTGFCVYNNAKSDVTFKAWPVSSHTFKKVVHPGGRECCAWDDPTCTAADEGEDRNNPLRECDSIILYITPRALDTDAITQKYNKEEIEKILEPLNRALARSINRIGYVIDQVYLLPGVGKAVGAVEAFQFVGSNLVKVNNETGIVFEADDRWVNAINGGNVEYQSPDETGAEYAYGIC